MATTPAGPATARWTRRSAASSPSAETRIQRPQQRPPPPPPPPALPKLGSSVFVSGKEGYNTYRIPAIVSNPGGKLLCFAEGRKLSSADHGWNDIVAKRSEDGGASWQPLQLVYGESTTAKPVTIGNPAPVAVGTTGKIVLVFCKNNLEVGVMTSLDFGGSWGKPRYIQSANPPHGKNGSWPWLATGPPQGLQLPSGRLVVGSDHRGFPASDHALVYSHAMYLPFPGLHEARVCSPEYLVEKDCDFPYALGLFL